MWVDRRYRSLDFLPTSCGTGIKCLVADAGDITDVARRQISALGRGMHTRSCSGFLVKTLRQNTRTCCGKKAALLQDKRAISIAAQSFQIVELGCSSRYCC
ncbi:hypothetical protein FOYG_02543 [Fusarium oxysporum NRRL 32931]|uniref:Uncharacterized protein n=1 Tax=Fusarium oxysporum NRRL 32931 TaxID=660029 RepID=W9IWS2_FUSOX|nr:hypothetical protein FOYG_02543 [Fusarium oxysporum NRRL 32931]